MDRERLNTLLQDPSQSGKQDLAALRSMAERFPWFSGAHLLLAVGEHGAGDVLANDRLSTPAAFLPSRAVLYDLVRKEEQPQETSMRVVKEQVPSIPASQAGFHSENVSEKTRADEDEPPAEPRTTAFATPSIPALPVPMQFAEPGDAGPGNETAEQPSIAAPGSEAFAEDRSVRKETENFAPPASVLQETPPDPALPTDILAQQIEEAIRASGYELSHSVPPPPEESLPEKRSVGIKPTVVPTSASVPRTPAQEETAHIPLTTASRLKFTDWLEQSSMDAQTALVPLAPATPQSEKSLEASGNMPVPAAKPPVLSTEEIMEQFIQRSAPVAIKAKASFFSPQQAAKKSLVDDGLVSETLAQILEKQGNFTKAREVYDRLALKHPEKSIYFAALSKALEGRSNK